MNAVSVHHYKRLTSSSDKRRFIIFLKSIVLINNISSLNLKLRDGSGWGDGSVVANIGCSSRGHGFKSQHPQDSL